MASWGKNEKGERKKEENYIKRWGKGLKNAFRGGVLRPPCLRTGLRPARRKLICREKKQGGGNDQNAQCIYLENMHNIKL